MTDLFKGMIPFEPISYLGLKELFKIPANVLSSFFYYRIQGLEGCEICGESLKNYKPKKHKPTAFQCPKCLHTIFPLIDTVFGKTHLPLPIIMLGVIEKCSHNSGWPALKIAELLEMTYEAAYNFEKRIRNWMELANNTIKMGNIISIDEASFNSGTKGLGDLIIKKRGFTSPTQTTVIAMRDQYGNVKATIVNERDESTIFEFILKYAPMGAILVTDEYAPYANAPKYGFVHKSVNHSKGIYITSDGYSTNGSEGFWTFVKRNISGTYIQVTEDCLQNYLEENIFRYSFSLTPQERLRKLFECLPPLYQKQSTYGK